MRLKRWINALDVSFYGILRLDQEAAVAGMLHHDAGVLCAPTAFGKTVTAAALIARRGVNTLVLVHRTELLKQWQERLQSFLIVDECHHVGAGIIRCDPEAGQGEVRARPHRHADSPRWTAPSTKAGKCLC